jgi:uncharacterized repeat protein (TIGR03803 family)
MHIFSLARTACLAFVVCAAMAVSSPAQTFDSLLGFDGTDGKTPHGLMQGTDGNFYGTTEAVGAHLYGTVYKITPQGDLTTLYSFCAKTNCVDGAYPINGLVQGTDGNFYGTTSEGGTVGDGTVFKITPTGTLTTLYSFCVQANCADGNEPLTTLIQASNGNFYGTTLTTIFEITPSGKLTTIYTFCTKAGCPDGTQPVGGLVQGSNGNLYGTTAYGGTSTACSNGCGTVFEVTPAGKLTTLYGFCAETNCADGETPETTLLQGTNGNFYGTTETGGSKFGGTVFEITSAGKLTTLYNFCSQSNCPDGENPYDGPLTQAADGNFYGTTTAGGAELSGGTIFKMTPAGRLTTLYSFCSQSDCTDGYSPTSLLQDTSGTFYGTTLYGGANGEGSVFSLSVGFGPFVENRPSVGSVGSKVTILGNNLSGSTSVSFNGTAATFTVVSETEITATVPSGATSGNIEVATPSGTLKSNVPFRVIE